MFKNILSSIRQHKLSAVLNITGLSIALTVTYLILSQYYYYSHWNRNIKDYKRIYRVETRIGSDSWTAYNKTEVNEKLCAHSPLIESHLIYDRSSAFTIVDFPMYEEASAGYMALRATDDNIGTLGIELTAGSFENIKNGNGIAIAESLAKENGIQLGDVAKIRRTETRTVEAIFKNLPDNSDFSVISIISDITGRGYDNDLSKEQLYIKLHNPEEYARFIEDAASIIASIEGDEYKRINKENIGEHLRLTRLDHTQYATDIDVRTNYIDPESNGFIWIIAITLLTIAFINYFNFFVALIPRRIRNINIRKVMGAQRLSVYIEFLMESVMLVSVALTLSLFVITYILPEEIMGHLLPVADKIYTFAVLATISITAAVVTAAYPAWYVTSFPPAFVLKGSFASGTSGKAIRNGLLSLQYIASFIFIIIALVQVSYYITVKKKDLGYDKDFHLYMSTVYDYQYNEYAAALKKCKAIKDVTFSLMSPILDYYPMEFHSINLDKKINLCQQAVSPGYTQFMGIDIIEGRTFSDNEDGDKYIVSESVRKQHGIEVGDRLSYTGTVYGEVIGICSDYINAPVGYVVAPSVLYHMKSHQIMNFVLFRLADGYTLSDAAPHIRKVDKDFYPNQKSSEIVHFDDMFKKAHSHIIDAIGVYGIFASVTIAIALLGVFGMVFFETQHRRKELAICRVNGATREDILRQFTIRYLKIVSICYAVAAPIAIALVKITDNNLAMYLSPWIFILAPAAVALLTFAIIVASAWKTLNENPSEVISKE